jgi:hypothetical protein
MLRITAKFKRDRPKMRFQVKVKAVQRKKSIAAPKIQEVHEFNARKAAKELWTFGFTAVDDIGRTLVDCAEEELFDELGLVADAMDIKRTEIESFAGPVFVFRDRTRVTLKAAKEWVAKHYPAVGEQE